MGLAVPDRRIDPVPSGRGVDEVERFGLALPGLERRDVDFNRQAGQVAARSLHEVCAHLDADHREAALERRTRRFAGRAANLQQASAGFELRKRDEVVEQLLRIRGSRRLVQVGGLVEGAPKRLARFAHRINRPEKRQVLRNPRCVPMPVASWPHAGSSALRRTRRLYLASNSRAAQAGQKNANAGSRSSSGSSVRTPRQPLADRPLSDPH